MEIDLKDMVPDYLAEQVREDLHLKEILDVGEVEKIILHVIDMVQDIFQDTLDEFQVMATCECLSKITIDVLTQGKCPNCQREVRLHIPVKGAL